MIALVGGVGAVVVVVVTLIVAVGLVTVIARSEELSPYPVATLVVLVISAAYLLKAG